MNSTQQDALKMVFAKKESMYSLRMAPMIDMIFLLLIFFLVAGKWRPEEDFLPLRLPTADARQQDFAKPEPLQIYIFASKTGCYVQIGEQQTVQIENEAIEANLAGLLQELRACMLAQKRYASDPVEIICAGQVKWEYIAKIYNMLFGAGLSDITFQMTE